MLGVKLIKDKKKLNKNNIQDSVKFIEFYKNMIIDDSDVPFKVKKLKLFLLDVISERC